MGGGEAQRERYAGSQRRQRRHAVPRGDEGDHRDLDHEPEVPGPVELLGDAVLATAEVIEEVDPRPEGEGPAGQHQLILVALDRRLLRVSHVLDSRPVEGARCPSTLPAVGLRVVPVGQQGPQRGEQHQRLVEHGVVASFRDLDHRGDAAERLVHGGADVLGDQAVL